MNITYLNINDLQVHCSFPDWLSEMPEFIVNDILSYRQPKDQWRVLGGKVLLNRALQSIGYPLSLYDLEFSDNGKPFFNKNVYPFNISHSGELVILVISEKNSCGIDIELHRNINYQSFVRNFTPKEWKIITEAENSRIQFFHYWAIKESLIKADGRGIEVLGKTEILSETTGICDGKKWFIYPFQIEDNYSSCLAIQEEVKWIQPIKITL